MITFFNKYKRFIYLACALIAVIMLFIPSLSMPTEENGVQYEYTKSTAQLFIRVPKYINSIKILTNKDANFYATTINTVKSALVPAIVGCVFFIAGILLAATTIILINKPIPYSAAYILLSLATIMKIYSQAHSIQGMGTFDAWTDYIIITIALLMLIVDIVRLSLYIRAHKDAIHAKAADITARFKTKLQREHKPTKDERIAELEERVKQLEDKQNE